MGRTTKDGTVLIRPFASQTSFTVFHNILLDVIMPELSGNQWKVLTYIVRRTIGWQKQQEVLSYEQIRTGTGIASDTTISACLDALEQFGYIAIERAPKQTGGQEWQANVYKLNTDYQMRVMFDQKTGAFVGQNAEKKTSKLAAENPENLSPTNPEIFPANFSSNPPTSKTEERPTPKNGERRASKNGERPTPKNGERPTPKNGDNRIKEENNAGENIFAAAAVSGDAEKLQISLSKLEESLHLKGFTYPQISGIASELYQKMGDDVFYWLEAHWSTVQGANVANKQGFLVSLMRKQTEVAQ